MYTSGYSELVKRRSLDRYENRYAQRTHGVRSSAMRDLMSITERPEVISLAGGLPDTAAFDTETLSTLLEDIVRTTQAVALQYGPTEGMALTREAICHVMAVEGMTVEPSDIIVTTGGQQVLDIFARTFIDPGDVVIAEGPTYPGVIPVFSSYQADVRQITLDEDGLDPQLLENLLNDLDAEGKTVKFLYMIPTFQNPSGVSTSRERRLEILRIARERDLLILEDNPYSLLRFEGTTLPTLRSLDESGIVSYLGTFSKIFAPGVRLGWVAAPPPILAKLNLAKQAADLCSSSLSQLLVARFVLEHDWQSYVRELCDHYKIRRDAMLTALSMHFPKEAIWTQPHGGLFVWATLPPLLDTTDLLARALDQNVAFVPGAAAYLDETSMGIAHQSMRLNFSAADASTIEEGVHRLGSAINEMLEIAHTLGLSESPKGVHKPGGGR